MLDSILQEIEKIEQKTGVNLQITAKIMRCAISRTRSEDFDEILVCLRNLDKLDQET